MEKYYTEDIEADMNYVYSMLNERQKRHYVALEAKKLGPKWHTYLSELFLVDKKTIKAGLVDLEKKSQ